jgi:hypothetical protein
MGSKADARRRWMGAILLLLAIVMLVLGETFMAERLRAAPLLALIFWLSCFGFVLLAIFVAFLDWMLVRRRLRAEQCGLVKETLHEIVEESRSRNPSPHQNDETRRTG